MRTGKLCVCECVSIHYRLLCHCWTGRSATSSADTVRFHLKLTGLTSFSSLSFCSDRYSSVLPMPRFYLHCRLCGLLYSNECRPDRTVPIVGVVRIVGGVSVVLSWLSILSLGHTGYPTTSVAQIISPQCHPGHWWYRRRRRCHSCRGWRHGWRGRPTTSVPGSSVPSVILVIGGTIPIISVVCTIPIVGVICVVGWRPRSSTSLALMR